jgi:hypothetical protein
VKRCLYSKCGKEFEPKKPKQKFCSAIHRVYYNRENQPKKEDGRKNNGNHQNFAGGKQKAEAEEQVPEFKNDIEKKFWEMKQKSKTK